MKNTVRILIPLVLLSLLLFVGRSKLAVFYFNKGNDFYERGMYEEAINYLNESIKINPSVSAVHYVLGNAYTEKNLEEAAAAQYLKAIELDSRFVWGYKALANIYLKRGSYQQAMDTLKKAQVFVPDNAEINDWIDFVSFEYIAYNLNTGVEALINGDRTKAYELFNTALQLNPDYVFTRYLLGYLYYSEQKYDQAEAMLSEAIRLDEKFLYAYKLLGDIYFEKSVFDKAIEAYKLALAVNEDDPIILSNIGLAYMNIENYNEAIAFLEKALDSGPGNLSIRYSLASVYRDDGRLSDAAIEYANVINVQQDYLNVHNDLADIFKEQGRQKDALEEYQKEIYFCQNKLSNNPDDPFVLVSMSHAYNGIGEYDRARELADKALSVKPDYREAYLTLATIYRNQEKPEESLAALEKAKGLSRQKHVFVEKAITDIRALKHAIENKIDFDPVDTVYLKNGRQLKGIIREQTEEGIILEINVGSSVGNVKLSRDSIERIVTEKQR